MSPHDNPSGGRLFGTLLLLQVSLGFIGNFVMMAPLVAKPGILHTAAAHPLHAAGFALLALAAAFLTLVLASLATSGAPAAMRVQPRILLGLAAASLALVAVEGAVVLAMVPLSRAFQTAAELQAPAFEAAGVLARGIRNGLHHTQLIVTGAAFLNLFTLVCRIGWIPRAFGIAAVAAVGAQVSLPLLRILGFSPPLWLVAPMLAYVLTLSGWLLVRGFRAPPAS